MAYINLETALKFPAPDVEALIQGRVIAAMPRMFIDPGRVFALYPTDISSNALPIEKHYRSNFLSVAKGVISQWHPEAVLVKAWAKCELCQILDQFELLEALSQLTVWRIEAFQQILSQRPYIFLAYLRVYLLPEPLVMPAHTQGQFMALPKSLTVADTSPVLSDRIFAQRRHQLENRLPPLHPELEELQSAIAQIPTNNLTAKEIVAAKQLDEELKIFLGWSSDKSAKRLDSDLSWIGKIAEIGNSSDGHTFEKLVRKGLLKLGFQGSGLDPESMGGAGGMDFYCETPYPIVGECKATKTEKVPDGTPAQLLKIGMNHLGKAQYDRSIKLIVAAGELNFYANRTATENQMNVIRPETLQELVKMQAQYKNSIDLLKLKECLQQAPFGLVDDKVNSYINKVRQDIEVRSQVIEAVKEILSDSNNEKPTANQVRLHYNATFGKTLGYKLTDDRVTHDLLVELSSPLARYLGREKGSDWQSDRFYFLCDLPID